MRRPQIFCPISTPSLLKDQLISKCLFGVFNSSKNQLENFNFLPSLLGQKKSFVFWKNWKQLTQKSHLEINWPLPAYSWSRTKFIFRGPCLGMYHLCSCTVWFCWPQVQTHGPTHTCEYVVLTLIHFFLDMYLAFKGTFSKWKK